MKGSFNEYKLRFYIYYKSIAFAILSQLAVDWKFSPICMYRHLAVGINYQIEY